MQVVILPVELFTPAELTSPSVAIMSAVRVSCGDGDADERAVRGDCRDVGGQRGHDAGLRGEDDLVQRGDVNGGIDLEAIDAVAAAPERTVTYRRRRVVVTRSNSMRLYLFFLQCCSRTGW